MTDLLFADPGIQKRPLDDEMLLELHRALTIQKYSEDQPRDERGRWSSGGGSPDAAKAEALTSWVSRPGACHEIRSSIAAGSPTGEAALLLAMPRETSGRPLYRGGAIGRAEAEALRDLPRGSAIDMNLTSFSGNKDVAYGFAERALQDRQERHGALAPWQPGGPRPPDDGGDNHGRIFVNIVGGASGVNVPAQLDFNGEGAKDHISTQAESEWILGGRFEVQETKWTTWPGYSGFSVTVWLKQVDALVKGTLSIRDARFLPLLEALGEERMADTHAGRREWDRWLAAADPVQKYSPDQERGEDGRWTTEGGERLRPLLDPTKPPRATSGPLTGGHIDEQTGRMVGRQREALPFKTDDPTRMANLTQSHRDEIMRVLTSDRVVPPIYERGEKKGQPNPDAGKPLGFPGMTVEKMEGNLRAVMERAQANPELVAGGKAWYGMARETAQSITDRFGFTLRQSVGVIAGMSPQHEWGSNAKTAEYVAQMVKENPILDLSPRQIAAMRAELDTKDRNHYQLSDVNGKHLDEIPLIEQASAIKAMGMDVPVRYEAESGRQNKATWSCGLAGMMAGIRVLRGEAPDDVLGGHKVRSFYNNILLGSTGDVTVDTHATSAAMGMVVPSSDPRIGAIMGAPSSTEYGTKGCYPLIADAYRAIAAEFHLPPEQAQAIIWMQWRSEHRGAKP